MALFMHAPPEHTAHIIDSALLFHGVRHATGLPPTWLTMNPRDPTPCLRPAAALRSFGLDGLAESCNVSVQNCAPLVADEFDPQPNELEMFLLGADPTVVYVSYYVPFWGPLVKVAHAHGVRIGLHVQVFFRGCGERRESFPFHFESHPGAREAVQEADFITVAQDADREVLCDRLGLTPSKIHVLLNGMPADAWESARPRKGHELLRKIAPRFDPDVPTVLNIGRFEQIKNLSWFLETCMPLLAGRESEFQVVMIGWGTESRLLQRLARPYRNTSVIDLRLDYRSCLDVIAAADLVLCPSGYDVCPRLPLEAILLGRPVILGEFDFNRPYFPYAKVLRPATERVSRLEYSGERVTYGVPAADEMVQAVEDFVERPPVHVRSPPPGDPIFERLDPNLSAAALIDAAQASRA